MGFTRKCLMPKPKAIARVEYALPAKTLIVAIPNKPAYTALT